MKIKFSMTGYNFSNIGWNCAIKLVYRSNGSFNMTPPGIPQAFDTFPVPGRREFDDQSLPGGGEFELHPRFYVKSLAW